MSQIKLTMDRNLSSTNPTQNEHHATLVLCISIVQSGRLSVKGPATLAILQHF